jgi:hypothetical protein
LIASNGSWIGFMTLRVATWRLRCVDGGRAAALRRRVGADSTGAAAAAMAAAWEAERAAAAAAGKPPSMVKAVSRVDRRRWLGAVALRMLGELTSVAIPFVIREFTVFALSPNPEGGLARGSASPSRSPR